MEVQRKIDDLSLLKNDFAGLPQDPGTVDTLAGIEERLKPLDADGASLTRPASGSSSTRRNMASQSIILRRKRWNNDGNGDERYAAAMRRVSCPRTEGVGSRNVGGCVLHLKTAGLDDAIWYFSLN